MGSNTNLTRESAEALLRGGEVLCPACQKELLQSRYPYKKQNVEFRCPHCGEIYHPAKLI